MRIAFLSRSLEVGGAERQLVVLANELARRGHTVAVALFYARGPLLAELQPAIQVLDIGKAGRWDLVGFLARLQRVVGSFQPQVLMTYLPVANLLGAVLRPTWPGQLRLIWNVRSSAISPELLPSGLGLVYRLEALFASRPDHILVNSRRGAEDLVVAGYPRDRLSVVGNGIDVTRYRPEPALRAQIRAEWGVGADETVIGQVGRLERGKGQALFLAAASRLIGISGLRFAVIGDGSPSERERLRAKAAELELASRVLWLPLRPDAEALYNGLDVLCSASLSEGFPNVVAEAMATATAVVATDVGDTAEIVDDYGIVVPPGDVAALAAAMARSLRLGRAERTRGREHIRRRYSVAALADSTEAVVASVIALGR